MGSVHPNPNSFPSEKEIDPSIYHVHHAGLQNLIGENNCFLNVVMQALWHIDAFRITLLLLLSRIDGINSSTLSDTDHHGCRTELLQSVCDLFLEYQYDKYSVLNPSRVRETLSKLSSQYRVGEIADSNEALDTILQQIHDEYPCGDESNNTCLAHW